MFHVLLVVAAINAFLAAVYRPERRGLRAFNTGVAVFCFGMALTYL